jgi:hypothetical protein
MTPFDYWDTPNPTETGFVIVAGEKDRRVPIPDFLNQVFLYSDLEEHADYKWITHAAAVVGDLRGYRLVHAAKSGVLQRAFYFARVRTQEERGQAFHESWVKRPFSWPTVLLKLWAEEGRLPLSAVDDAGGIVTTENLLVRSRHRPGGMFPTWFRIRQYLSEVPFGRSSRQQVPITDAIHWEFDGMRGGFPECLHPGVTVPNDTTTGAVKWGFGTDSDLIGEDLVKQEYPPTLMTNWTKYVLEDDRQKVMGLLMEHRTLVEVIPPTDTRENVS